MPIKYDFESIRLKGNIIRVDEYLLHNIRLSNMLKYGKIDEKLFTKCQWYAFTKLQKSYLKPCYKK